MPHDSAHVLTGYDTTPHGELLVSTFTANMHRREPMAGHVLRVIFSWQLGDQINAVAGGASGALDAEAFWEAWAAGARSPVDTFAPDWDFWREAGRPLAAVRGSLAIPPEGLSRTAAPRAATA